MIGTIWIAGAGARGAATSRLDDAM